MKGIYLKHWWTLSLKGLFALLFGTLAIISPAGMLGTVVSLFGIALLIMGVLFILTAFLKKIRKDRSWNLTEGFLDIMIATITLSLQVMNSGIFLTMVAIWISFVGILQISNRYRLNGLFNHWWYLIFNAVLSIIFAALIFTFPMQGLVTRGILILLQAGILIGFIAVSSCHIRKLLKDIRIDIPSKEGDEGNQELSYY